MNRLQEILFRMSCEPIDVDNVQVQMIMVIALQRLKREGGADLSYRNLEDYLKDVLWKDGAPSSLNEAADEILKITSTDIVRFLSKKAIAESGRASLADFSDLIGGN